ncbi:class I SAM-dependent methyltransferase [Agrobacterium cavarae]|uniref:Class I SAM-dependent methyltransferase n=1 Tax=Agrobacterium cavarae TaxID=2528239 RepID=A0ABY1Y5T2_9HYPH|nr:class I SAM-dependent methyltransferase [Agrobacterium cavarae]TBN10899.1 class I SAM-dependent methyltransferase [Agrobacterium cavarae]
MKCRHCASELRCDFLDLGFAPPSNAYLTKDALSKPEVYFPLRLKVCEECWLVQTEDYASAETFFSSDYAYFSSASRSWLDHASRYTDMITKRLGLSNESMVIEVASNDGYLLRNFVAAGIPCLGIEPTDSTAEAAEAQGIPVLRKFFGEELAKSLESEGRTADLILGNNVYAHVPDINDFTRGLKAALKSEGTITLEFPHLMELIEHNQFDTVYHEHFSYLSLFTVQRIFEQAGLRVFDVEQLTTHGGSLRVYGCHDTDQRPTLESVQQIIDEEAARGLRAKTVYAGFQQKAEAVKNDVLRFLLQAKQDGKTVGAYGAAAKGNTLLNFAGVKPDLLPFVCDAAAAKQNKYLPGSHIPVVHPDEMKERGPDYVVILPWNIFEEVGQQLAFLTETKFVTCVPHLALR